MMTTTIYHHLRLCDIQNDNSRNRIDGKKNKLDFSHLKTMTMWNRKKKKKHRRMVTVREANINEWNFGKNSNEKRAEYFDAWNMILQENATEMCTSGVETHRHFDTNPLSNLFHLHGRQTSIFFSSASLFSDSVLLTKVCPKMGISDNIIWSIHSPTGGGKQSDNNFLSFSASIYFMLWKCNSE